MPQDSARRLWTGTLNNPTQEELTTLLGLTAQEAPELVVGEELAPTTGTPHVHIYVRLAQRKRLSSLKALSERAHWEPVHDRKNCIEYCRKGGKLLIDRL